MKLKTTKMTIIALIMTSVKRRRDIVDILGFDVAGKLSDDIVKNTAMASNIVMAYPTLSPLSAGSKNTKTFKHSLALLLFSLYCHLYL
jgi:hypothetical protein